MAARQRLVVNLLVSAVDAWSMSVQAGDKHVKLC